MTSKEIRQRFLDFFKEKYHKIVPSAPMVVTDDPTLLFTNAGMNQFKEYFLGHGTPEHPRVTDTQKCLRVSGKHNDLEEVGKDTYHHTMFEMLGNWSFGTPSDLADQSAEAGGEGSGGYFKKEAIAWAWEFLVDRCGIEADRLYATVFEGSEEDGLPMDQEAFDRWKRILPEERILAGSKKDNFWEMGDQGPCGPSSEIHVDIRTDAERAKIDGASLVNMDHPQVVEIWNLVFIQYNRKADGTLEPLPAKHVDTGMGFERLCMVLQGVRSNYDTDLFTPLIREIETITHSKYGATEEVDVAMRVIADHIRAVSFAIADGQLPGNTGAGYVIRRILRRAVRYGFTFLDTKGPFMHRLVGTLVETMGGAFPELGDQRRLIENVVREEEQSFLNTLEQGLGLLDEVLKKQKGTELEGRKAFELYDTYGFPVDLTALILEEKGYTLDEAGFEAAMQEQKNRSRQASEVSKGDWHVLVSEEGKGFVGYDTLESEVTLRKYRKVSTAKEGNRYQLVFDQTPFYPEGGGQVGDKGYLEAANGDVVYITDTKRENNEIVHFAESLPERPEATLKAVVDHKQRQRTAANHTATHLLHQALRKVLGTHVEQKGSAVHSRYLRFDFSHFAKMTTEELDQVERFVNARIEGQLPLVEQRAIPMKEALAEGAMALFGEKYGDRVRTVRFGKSIELCGGTHVNNTGDIWQFKIVSEGAVAAGIRRIEAITSDAVRDYYRQTESTLAALKEQLNNVQDPVKAVASLQTENAELRKEIEQLRKDKAKNLEGELTGQLETIDGVRFLAKKVELDAAGLKDLCFSMGGKHDDLFLLFGTEQDGKALLACYISKPLVQERDLNAGTIVRELGQFIQGGGGGQPFFATAGGKNPKGIETAFTEARKMLA